MIALFFDTETTGFKHDDFIPEIVQIGAIVQDTDTRRVLAELNIIVRNEVPIPPRVSEIHGITDEMTNLYGVNSIAAENMFTAMVDMSNTVVAHNLAFDMGIIKDHWPNAHRVVLEKESFCTMLQSVELVGIQKSHAGGNKWPKLIEAYQYFFDTDFDNQHDAMADVRACRDVFFKLQESTL